MLMAKFLHVSAGAFTCDPVYARCKRCAAGSRGGRCDFAIEGHRSLERNERSVMADVLSEGLVQILGFLLQHARGHRDAGILEFSEPLTADQRIRIRHAGNYPRNPGGDHCVSTWASATLVRAWLQIDVESCAARFNSSLFDGENFGVLQTIVGMTSRANDCTARVSNHCSHARIG